MENGFCVCLSRFYWGSGYALENHFNFLLTGRRPVLNKQLALCTTLIGKMVFGWLWVMVGKF